ncbi:O-antigen ligase family protein [Occultella gossypii]|uniref:O-antigen ligase family protein n=1 Tax=Occultella gossypii TaxID=2800820 RepID=A0ABS7SFJ0_9MICO|nr:O-antigen ligase family protein [Occultella gossypii]MBZ2199131.1 O-antigen ligase family protein [Occultella gossypii]
MLTATILTTPLAGASSFLSYVGLPMLGAGVLLNALRRRSTTGSPPSSGPVLLATWLVLTTLVTALFSDRAEVAPLALVGLVALTACLAASYYRSASDLRVVESTILVATSILAIAFIAFAGPRVIGGGANSWALIYENSNWINSNTLGLVFAIAIGAGVGRTLRNERRLLPVLAVTLCTAALALTFSRSAYLAAGAILLHVLVGKRKAFLLLLPVLLIGYANLPMAVQDRVTYTTAGSGLDPSSSVRLELWRAALAIARDNPVLGVGFHSIRPALVEYGAPDGLAFPHNAYLTLLLGAGAITFAIVIAWIGGYCVRLVRQSRQDPTGSAWTRLLTLTAALVCSFFGEPLLSPIPTIMLLALLTAPFVKPDPGRTRDL